MPPRRHDWVYLRPSAEVALAPAEDEAVAYARSWLGAGRPLVVARQHAGDDEIALGLALPRSFATRRLACIARRADILRHRNPLTVEEAAPALSAEDAAALSRFAAAVAGHALSLGVYGSTAWDCIAGGGYRHEASDVDLVVEVASSAGLSACLAAFADATRDFRSRIDGEVRVPGGRAIAWRELADACAAGPAVVLAKGERDVAIVALHHALAPLR